MKRKWLVLGTTAVLVVAFGLTASANLGFNLDTFKKELGIKQIQEGVVVDLPTNSDKQVVVDSIDPKTGGPTKYLKPKAGNMEVLYKNLIAEDSGNSLKVPYVKNGTKDVAIYDPNTTLQTIPIPGTEDYLIPFDGTIYKTNWSKGTLNKLLKDEVNGYQKDEILSHKLDHVGTPMWGAYPMLNPTASYLLFFTERSMASGDKDGETWVKNMVTGEEKPVLSGTGKLLGWIKDTTAVISGQFIYSIDLTSGESKRLTDVKALDAGLVKNQLVYQSSPGSLTFKSVDSGEISTISSKLLHISGSYQTQGSWLAINNQVKDGSAEHSIVLYNIDTKTWKLVSEPSDQLINGVSWQDDSTLLLLTYKKGTTQELTYTVNINELEDVR
ncbi:hypothetical protein [Paenibacillus koleovorans]|uniref:hypothetical protein n=1 Tax=Paenibacillus koleovorans TaxID=121608 RepID=UPI000FDA983A|nr:hypothetical protein [Paenibacillus koleovorans]